MAKYSIIVPVFNRPDEVRELLQSLINQEYKDFEVIIVEDGSQVPCEEECKKVENGLDIKYFFKPNSGPGQSRNYGAERSSGEYFIVLDSDVVLPSGYLKAVDKEITSQNIDAFGGPDSSHSSFTRIQKAISYSMTSFFTTGGIRGGKKKLDKFYPRSFNMGIKANVYTQLNGFSKMRFGEDIDFSIRIYNAGYSCKLLPTAWVWHKRRTDFRKFYRQVFNSGIARINLFKKYPSSLKLVHMLPAVFTVAMSLLFLLSIIFGIISFVFENNTFRYISLTSILLILSYCALIFIDSSIKNKSISIGFLSIISSFTQLFGYGCGFILAWWKQCVKGEKEFNAFSKTFYK